MSKSDRNDTSMLDDLPLGKRLAGQFAIKPEKTVYGELTLAGRETSLYLQDKEPFHIDSSRNATITGVLNDLTRVTLVDCIATEPMGSSHRGDESYHFAEVFPHFVVYGDKHIVPRDNVVTEATFAVDDAAALLYDTDAFSKVLAADKFIDALIAADGDKTVPVGPHPEVLYFTGRRELFTVSTVIGQITAANYAVATYGTGVSVKSDFLFQVAFRPARKFHEAIGDISLLTKYLGLLIGRPQNLLKLYIFTPGGDVPAQLKVYWSLPPRRDTDDEVKASRLDVLMSGARESLQFARVLRGWLERSGEWNDARQRFFTCFERPLYDIDRLVAAANMFDILPDSAVPADVEVHPDLRKAVDDARAVFRALPETAERNSVLNALGRVGKAALKHKIRHRARLIAQSWDRFSERDLVMVADEAVNCRNHYVHGSPGSFDYWRHRNMLFFFTDTLQFVFAVSDLIEAGWDLRAWGLRMTTLYHPFARYRIGYPENLGALKSLLGRENT